MAFFALKKKNSSPLEVPSPMPIASPSMEMPQQQSANSPIEQVLMMKQQGYTSNQIMQALQSQGYDINQIYDSLNQAGMSSEIPPQQYDNNQQYNQGGYEDQFTSFQQPQQQQEYQQPPPAMPIPQAAPMPSFSDDRIQEVTEAIIEEKWDEFARDIRKVIEWKDRTEDRIAKIEQQMIDIRLTMDSLTKSIIGKITAYDQNILDVGTEIKAMEKVFQKVLPNLTENVNKLERMTRGFPDKDYSDPLARR